MPAVETQEPLSLLLAALRISVPIFSWVILGAVLARVGVLRDRFINIVSRFSFNIALPIVLLVGSSGVNYTALGNASYLYAGIISSLLVFGLSWLYGRWREFPAREVGIFVQGAFRSNLAVIGIALCVAAYGDRGLVLAAPAIAVLTILFNILAIWVLDSTLGNSNSVFSMTLGIMRNPLIVGILIGALVSVSGVVLPEFAGTLSGAITTYFIPLLLTCIGGSIRLQGLGSIGGLVWEASLWRLLISPVIAICVALLMGVRGDTLGVYFLLLSSPVAAASFVMVVAGRGDGGLAANIIVLTSFLSLVSVTVGFFLLSLLRLV
jgi:predicted permease